MGRWLSWLERVICNDEAEGSSPSRSTRGLESAGSTEKAQFCSSKIDESGTVHPSPSLT